MGRDHLGVVAENLNRQISIFSTDAQEVLQRLPLDADIIGVAVTGDCTRAFVTSFNSKTLYQIDLCASPARVMGSAVSSTRLEDVAVTPDGQYALSVDGGAGGQDIVSYSARQNAFASALPASAQAVAISPRSRELVLTVDLFDKVVRRFAIHPDGSLEDTGQTVPTPADPFNLAFSPDGAFAFLLARKSSNISVLSTLNPRNVTLLGGVPSSPLPQSLAVARDGRHVFVLADSNVDVYAFDPVAGSLALERSFAHGLTIASYYGVEQIALDACGTKLFISGLGRVAVFTTCGLPLGDVAGAEGPGGIAICPCLLTVVL